MKHPKAMTNGELADDVEDIADAIEKPDFHNLELAQENIREAAARLRAMGDENARLRETLKPFAEIGLLFRYYTEDQFSLPLQFPDYDTRPNINVPFPSKTISGIDFRRAAAVLNKETKKEPGPRPG